MTPKEKAIEMYSKFYGIPLYIKTVKECCMIMVNELIRVSRSEDDSKEYWEEVKKEIEKL